MTFPKPVKTGTTIAGCVFKVSSYSTVEVANPVYLCPPCRMEWYLVLIPGQLRAQWQPIRTVRKFTSSQRIFCTSSSEVQSLCNFGNNFFKGQQQRKKGLFRIFCIKPFSCVHGEAQWRSSLRCCFFFACPSHPPDLSENCIFSFLCE